MSFARSWLEYEQGFGDVKGGFWRGLEFIYNMTRSVPGQMIRIDMTDSMGRETFVQYDSFSLQRKNKYQLNLGHYLRYSTAS